MVWRGCSGSCCPAVVPACRLTLEWTYLVIFAVLFPIAFFCIPPLLAALIGGRVGRHLDARGQVQTGLPVSSQKNSRNPA